MNDSNNNQANVRLLSDNEEEGEEAHRVEIQLAESGPGIKKRKID